MAFDIPRLAIKASRPHLRSSKSDVVRQRPPLPHLPRHPFHGASEWQPSGILLAEV